MKKLLFTVTVIAAFFAVTSAQANEPVSYEKKGNCGTDTGPNDSQSIERPGQCNLQARDNNNDGYLFERNSPVLAAQRTTRVSNILAGQEGQSSKSAGETKDTDK